MNILLISLRKLRKSCHIECRKSILSDVVPLRSKMLLMKSYFEGSEKINTTVEIHYIGF